MFDFKNKVVVITGAGSGIGRSLALQLASKGARLALSDFNPDGLSETMQLINNKADVKSYLFDVSSKDAVFQHAEDVKRDFGTAHYIINNAGATIAGTIEHLTIDEIEWQLSVNLWGVIYGTKAFLPMFLQQKEGCVVNISSVFGLVGYPCQGAYNISKFGVRGLTECLWNELDDTGVRAVSVHPGGVKTNIDKAGRSCENAGEVENKEWVDVSTKLLLTPPDECAAQIIKGLEQGKRRILAGYKARTIFWLSRLFPNNYPFLLKLLK